MRLTTRFELRTIGITDVRDADWTLRLVPDGLRSVRAVATVTGVEGWPDAVARFFDLRPAVRMTIPLLSSCEDCMCLQDRLNVTGSEARFSLVDGVARLHVTGEVLTAGCRLRVYCGNIQTVADFTWVVGFQWDKGNARKSFDKHSVSQAEAEQVFFNEPLLVVEDVKHSQLEARFHALGVTNSGRQLHVTFTLRGENTKIRVISARDMHSKERSRYGQET